MMRAVVTREAGRPDVLEVQQREIPNLQANDVLIRVKYTCVNTIDLTERKIHAGKILGYECSGIIEKVGTNVRGWKVNQKVCALLPGQGGYAEYVSVPSNMLFHIPHRLGLRHAASFPLVSCTTLHALSTCGLEKGKSLLIHDDSGGDGIFALRLAKTLFETTLLVVSGNDKILKRYKHYGADVCINRTNTNFVDEVRSLTKSKGVDIVINYGGGNVTSCQQCLTLWGVMMVICDVEDKRIAEFSIHNLRKNSSAIIVCDLRILMTSWSEKYKSSLVNDVRKKVWPLFHTGKIECEELMTMSLSKAQAARTIMEEGQAEKIILTIKDEPQNNWNLNVTSLNWSALKLIFSRIRGPPSPPPDSISTKTKKIQ